MVFGTENKSNKSLLSHFSTVLVLCWIFARNGFERCSERSPLCRDVCWYSDTEITIQVFVRRLSIYPLQHGGFFLHIAAG